MSRLTDFRAQNRPQLPASSWGCGAQLLVAGGMYLLFAYLLQPSVSWFAANAFFVLTLVAIGTLYVGYRLYQMLRPGGQSKPNTWLTLLLGMALFYYGNFAWRYRSLPPAQQYLMGDYQRIDQPVALHISQSMALFMYAKTGNEINTTYVAELLTTNDARLLVTGTVQFPKGASKPYTHRFMAHWQRDTLWLKDEESTTPDFVFVKQ